MSLTLKSYGNRCARHRAAVSFGPGLGAAHWAHRLDPSCMKEGSHEPVRIVGYRTQAVH